jgi:hypothetical protein
MGWGSDIREQECPRHMSKSALRSRPSQVQVDAPFLYEAGSLTSKS